MHLGNTPTPDPSPQALGLDVGRASVEKPEGKGEGRRGAQLGSKASGDHLANSSLPE